MQLLGTALSNQDAAHHATAPTDRPVRRQRARWKIAHWLLVLVMAGLDWCLVVAAISCGDALYRLALYGHLGFGLESFALGQVLGVLTVGYVHYHGGYESGALATPRRDARIFLQGWVLAFFILGWVVFLAQTANEFSRGGVTAAFLSIVPALILRASVRSRLHAYLASLRIASRTVFLVHAGDNTERARIERQLGRQGIELSGGAHLDPDRLMDAGGEGSLRRAIAEARRALAEDRFDAVYLSAPWQGNGDLRRIRAMMAALPVPTFLFVDPQTARLARGDALHLGRLTAFQIQRAPLGLLERMAKRGLDVALSALLLIVLSPLLALVSLAIMAESGAPILFRQRRQGFGGKVFSILKFRTMTVCEDGERVVQAQFGDARVTPLGRVLRRTSIDELPQLLNVLKGEMSLVGPRPHALAHDSHYDLRIATYASRRHVKPGLTGWAQVNGCRGETREVSQMEARVEHDLWYVNHWSIWLDLKILLRTAFVVVAGDQAY